jgi:Flp pilus assembly protein TadD
VTFAILLALANRPLGLHDGRWEEGLRMAQRLVILGRYEEAETWVRRFEPRGPRPGATHYGVGAQLMLVNQPELALGHLQKADALTPGQPQVEYALGQALLKTKRAADAVPYLRRGFDAGIDLPLGGYDLAVALHAAGDFAGAVDVIRRIQPAADVDDPEAWSRLGRLATRARAPDVAEAYFRRAVEIRPAQASTRQQLGLNLVVLNRCDEAVRELSEAARLDPRDPDTFSHLAYCELQRGNIPAARAHASTALSLDPANRLAQRVRAAVSR